MPWDPGWAEEAFGGQPLYGGAPRQGVKREEVELCCGGEEASERAVRCGYSIAHMFEEVAE